MYELPTSSRLPANPLAGAGQNIQPPFAQASYSTLETFFPSGSVMRGMCAKSSCSVATVVMVR